MVIITITIVGSVMIIKWPRFAICRPDRDSTRQVHAEHPEQEKLTYGFYARTLGKVGAQMPFGQQIREERHDSCPGGLESGDQCTKLVLETQSEHWPILIRDIGILEGKENPVAVNAGERADWLIVKQDVEDVDISHDRPHQGCRRGARTRAHRPRSGHEPARFADLVA